MFLNILRELDGELYELRNFNSWNQTSFISCFWGELDTWLQLAKRTPRKRDAVPFDNKRIQHFINQIDGFVDLKNSQNIDWEFIPFEKKIEIESLQDHCKNDLNNFRDDFGKKTMQTFEYVVEFFSKTNSYETPSKNRYCPRYELDLYISGNTVLLGQPYIDITHLDDISIYSFSV